MKNEPIEKPERIVSLESEDTKPEQVTIQHQNALGTLHITYLVIRVAEATAILIRDLI